MIRLSLDGSHYVELRFDAADREAVRWAETRREWLADRACEAFEALFMQAGVRAKTSEELRRELARTPVATIGDRRQVEAMIEEAESRGD